MGMLETMLGSAMPEMADLGKVIEAELDLRKHLNLPLLKKIQQRFPKVVGTGSCALYLHGIRFKRWEWKEEKSDLDIVCIDIPDFTEIGINFVSYQSDTHIIFRDKETGGKVDLFVRTPHRYQSIVLDQVCYKVACLEGIWKAKLDHAYNGSTQKHIQDLQEAMGIKPQRNIDRELYQIEQEKRYSSGS